MGATSRTNQCSSFRVHVQPLECICQRRTVVTFVKDVQNVICYALEADKHAHQVRFGVQLPKIIRVVNIVGEIAGRCGPHDNPGANQ